MNHEQKPLPFDPVKLTHYLLRVILVIVGLASTQAGAQFNDAESAITYRQGAFHMVSIHMQRINGMLRNEAPFDRARLVRSSGLVRDLIALPWEAFLPGSEGGNAKDDIWLDDAKFQELAKKIQDDTRAFAELAKTADQTRLSEAYKEMRVTCQNCHRQFRNPQITRGN